MEQRIEKLERQNRIYRNLFILAGLVVVALLTWGAARPITGLIQARRFEVTEKDGNVVARLGHYYRGSGSLEILTREGAVVIETSALQGNGFLKVYREHGEVIFTTEKSGL